MASPKVVSLFSGAGGLDIGFERHGFEVVATCEIEPIFCKSLQSNQDWTHSDGRKYFQGTSIINEDVAKIDFSQFKKIDCVIGGPPCQSFSSSGKQLSVLDERGSLVYQFCRAISEIRPKAFLFENVRGIVTARDNQGKPGGVIREIFNQLENLGYSCRASLLNSADFGSFQRRVRCFIIGVKNGKAPEFPSPTHCDTSKGTSLFQQPWLTLNDFLKEFSDPNQSNWVFPTEELGEQLKNLPEGTGLKSAGVSEPTRPGGHWGYRQGTFIADKALPARTVTGSSSQDWVRWSGVLRRLTLLEVKRLQGFPEDWVICGNKAEIFKQIGNAVPTIFGEVLAATIKDYLKEKNEKKFVSLGFPEEFWKYIDYTVRDHEKNKSARKIHQNFEG